MFARNIEKLLDAWKKKPGRKPLIIRGARQVGKTSIVEKFGINEFSTYVYLNLEKESDQAPFKEMVSISEVINFIEIIKNTKIIPGDTLLFIDEIQASSVAMAQLRYFFEELPELHIIAAGSLLEVKMKKEGFSFPVGRVEYGYLNPATFDEYLGAMGETSSLDFISSYKLGEPLAKELNEVFLRQYLTYNIVGGMPEIVWKYSQSNSI
ncbi:MAG: AAA family ATPase, partial [Candidatus Margulisbacteria bacterium]|nr:AAA family ATPase [Candidatus Margulisiibacteriota bacterium]